MLTTFTADRIDGGFEMSGDAPVVAEEHDKEYDPLDAQAMVVAASTLPGTK